MASPHDAVSMAVFCDFENVALGVRDAKYDKFDIKRVLERLLLKGSIVVKKAYCDWERYKGFKATMHEASFELIEIPHVRQSGKNSADIRLVVDALDLCYTKSHVNTFVIISGDSDFSPLVSKLRENAKQVIGVGVKQSTSDLLIANCDEFIFYDDLVRESQRTAKQDTRETQPAKRSPDEEKRRRDEQEARKTQAVELAVETFDALVAERGDSGKIWASLLKEAIKRRKPGFNESYYGFRAFGNLLEEAQSRGLLDLGRDEKSGAYVYRRNGGADAVESAEEAPAVAVSAAAVEPGAEALVAPAPARRHGRGRRHSAAAEASVGGEALPAADEPAPAAIATPAGEAGAASGREATGEAAAASEHTATDSSPAPQPASATEEAPPAPNARRGSRRRGAKPAPTAATDERAPAAQATAEMPRAPEPAAVIPAPGPAATDAPAVEKTEKRRPARGTRKSASAKEEPAPAAGTADTVEPAAAAKPDATPARRPTRSRRPRKAETEPGND